MQVKHLGIFLFNAIMTFQINVLKDTNVSQFLWSVISPLASKTEESSFVQILKLPGLHKKKDSQIPNEVSDFWTPLYIQTY